MKTASLIIAASLVSTMANATEIRVFSGGAPKEVFMALTPKFEQQTGHKVTFVYEVITGLRERIAKGEKADVFIMPVPVLDGYAKDGKLGARATFGSMGLDVVVPEGKPKPDISTKDKFKAAMLAARSVVHATPGKTPSGTHMGKLWDDLGIAGEMAKKVVHKPALEGGVEMVAKGEVDIGIYPASEVLDIKGVSVVGMLPGDTNLVIVYGGAATAGSPDAAAQFVKFMAAPENRAAWQHGGFEPPR